MFSTHAKILWVVGVLLGIVALLFLWQFNGQSEEGTVVYWPDREVAVRVEVVDTPATRELGLSGHVPLGEYEGMLFLFEEALPHGFWMKDMLFPLDIIWMLDGEVVHVEEHVPTPPAEGVLPVYRPTTAANAVLEVNAGFVDMHPLEVGDKLEW